MSSQLLWYVKKCSWYSYSQPWLLGHKDDCWYLTPCAVLSSEHSYPLHIAEKKHTSSWAKCARSTNYYSVSDSWWYEMMVLIHYLTEVTKRSTLIWQGSNNPSQQPTGKKRQPWPNWMNKKATESPYNSPRVDWGLCTKRLGSVATLEYLPADEWRIWSRLENPWWFFPFFRIRECNALGFEI